MNNDTLPLEDALDELSSAEDFLNYFEIDFDATVVHVNRLHIMQRYHDYLAQAAPQLEQAAEPAQREIYRRLLAQAYVDFVESDALTEKVFKVFRAQEGGFVPLEDLLGARS